MALTTDVTPRVNLTPAQVLQDDHRMKRLTLAFCDGLLAYADDVTANTIMEEALKICGGDPETLTDVLKARFFADHYGLPRNVGWPTPIDMGRDDKESLMGRCQPPGVQRVRKVLLRTYSRPVHRGDWGVFDKLSESSDPRRLLELVLQAKFKKSYQEPYAALDALYGVIIQDAAVQSGLADATKLAGVVGPGPARGTAFGLSADEADAYLGA